MRYWDASALVPLVVEEEATRRARAWLAEDPTILTWAWTRVELAGAVERRARQGELSQAQRRAALSRFDELARSWDEVVDLFAVRARALALLARHDLRAADAAQLAAALLAACAAARSAPRGRLHVVGLVSDGGVHSGWEHIEAMIEMAAAEGVPDLVLHALTDGRDTLPTSGAGYVEEAQRWLKHAGRIGTVGGRYWGMDRDRRWDRTKRAYDAIVHGSATRSAESAPDAVKSSYAEDTTDEFIEPTIIEAKDPKFRTMCEEIFGPVLTVYVYDAEKFEETLDLVDNTSPYALTGAVIAQDRAATELANRKLRNAAGNFYINDKPTGAVVGQQPFGGARGSGTNDKAGSMWNLARWVTPRTVKETFVPPTDYRYPFLGPDSDGGS